MLFIWQPQDKFHVEDTGGTSGSILSQKVPSPNTLSTAVLSINTHDVSVSAEDQHILKEERGETEQFSSHHQAF